MDTYLKMKTQASATMLSFCKGLMDADEDEEEDNQKDGSEILNNYVSDILKAVAVNLNIGITQKNEPLQAESL